MSNCYFCYYRPVCDGTMRCRYYTDIREDADDPRLDTERLRFRDEWVRYIYLCDEEGLLTLDVDADDD